MKIYLGTDHAGFEMKEVLSAWLQTEGYDVEDLGAYIYDAEDDFPDFVMPVAERVATEEGSRGIVLGGSGQGEAMASNRIRGVRCAVYYGYDMEIVRLSREHNDSNVLSLGARFLQVDEMKEAVKIFLETETLTDEKYHRRNDKLDVST